MCCRRLLAYQGTGAALDVMELTEWCEALELTTGRAFGELFALRKNVRASRALKLPARAACP